MISEIIASLAFQTVQHVFSGNIGGEGNDRDRPALRLKNLTLAEIEQFLGLWEAHTEGTELSDVKVVIAHDSGLDVDSRYLADPERSITYYRNNIDTGLLYIQTKIESDEQGLESLFTIQDRNYLDGSLDTDGVYSAEKTLIKLCWEKAGGPPPRFPSKLPDHLGHIRKSFQTNNIPFSVRTYATFAYKVCSRLLSVHESAIDKQALSEAIGESLVALGLFPDPEWKDNPNDLRRLISNFRLADLMNPVGVDQDPEELKSLIENTDFHDEEKQLLPAEQISDFRKLCIKYVENREEAIREQIPYGIYLQIFYGTSLPGVPLGERVRNEISETEIQDDPISEYSHVSEFDDLEVFDGLNSRDQEAAKTFLEAEPPENSPPDTPPLSSLIKPSTQKILKKLAYPRARKFENPLIQIIEILRTFDDREILAGSEMELRPGPGAQDFPLSRALFSFMYAATLKEISEISGDDPSGVQLVISDDLLQIEDVPDLPGNGETHEDLEAPDELEPLSWEGLPVEFIFSRPMENGEKEIFDEVNNLIWKPREIDWFAFLWLMTCSPDAPGSDMLLERDDVDFEALVSEVTQRLHSVSSYFNSQKIEPEILENGRIAQLVEQRNDFIKTVSETGFQISAINDYVGNWTSIIKECRNEFVPNGVLDKRLQMVISQDIIHCHHGSMSLMLGTHPLRLRWIGKYFTELRDLCVSALGFDLKLNETNDEYFLSNLENISPHAQPPILANSLRTLMVPVSENGFCEIFAAIKKEGAVTTLWKSEMDTVSLKVISSEITAYLHAHPHKEDGLSILFILPSGGEIPRHLIESIRQGNLKNLPVSCHVFSPKNEWEKLVTAFQQLETESRISGDALLNPPLQLFLNDWKGETEAVKKLTGSSFDISIVPNFFGDKVDVNEHAEPPANRGGSFHILFDRPDYVDRDADAGTVSIVLKPELPDEAIQDWSTMNVRLLRSEAIASENPEYTDFVKLRIRFDEAASLFSILHQCSHWVITLDHYVGRDQIENLPQKPDVLTVKEGVGLSGLYTLVVSSDAGKDFVIKRLSRKLERIASSVDSTQTRILAEKVYDEIREISPGLILRSLGLSRVTEEVLGLMVAKKIVETESPPDWDNSVSVWISLDEHSEWFGGDHGVRADLCRLDFARVDDRLHVGLVVVEGKLRQNYDNHGVDQVLRTLRLLSAALQPTITEEGNNAADARFWRQSILNAVFSCSERAIVAPEGTAGTARIRSRDLEDFRDGRYDFSVPKGIYSICLYENFGETKRSQEKGVEIFRCKAPEIIDLIAQGQKEPASSTENINLPSDTSDQSPDISETTRPKEDVFVADGTQNHSFTDQGETTKEITEDKIEPDHELIVVTSETGEGVSEDRMIEMYQKILDTLEDFKVSVEVPNDGRAHFLEGPAFIQFRVKPQRGVNPDAISQQSKSLHLNLELSHNQVIHFVVDRGTVNIDVPKAEEDRYYVKAETMWKKWAGSKEEELLVPLGENQNGEIVTVNFSSSNSPHLLIGGATGSGKSEALNSILYGLIHFYSPEQLRLVLIDPKQVELAAFEKAPHLKGDIGYFDDDAVNSLSDAVEEMQNRYKLFKDRGVKSLAEYNSNVDPSNRLPWIVIVLDEYADLVADPDIRKTIEGLMRRLSAKARACGIHVIIATQKPSADNISTTIRSNLPAQLALRCRGKSESNIIMGESGAEALNGKGDAFLHLSDKLERIQCAMYSGNKTPWEES